MYSKVLDNAMLSRVVMAAPEVNEWSQGVIMDVLKGLVGVSAGKLGVSAEERVIKGRECWCMSVSALASVVNVSAHQAGRALGELGLVKLRRKKGYFVFWNREQLDLLCEALEVSNGLA